MDKLPLPSNVSSEMALSNYLATELCAVEPLTFFFVEGVPPSVIYRKEWEGRKAYQLSYNVSVYLIDEQYRWLTKVSTGYLAPSTKILYVGGLNGN